MLQISNLNEGKTEWNLNETHIIIPMVEGDVMQNKDGEKIAKNTITLNALDGSDQTVLTNAMEHTLVIGLERNIFENYNHKNDLVFIQNSELKKLLPLNSDSKNAITYTVSYTEPSKNEVSWDNSLLRERSKTDWCFNQNEKHVFEVRDVLNYSDVTQDSSKGWQDCTIEKSNNQIVLEGIDGTGINGDLLGTNSEQVTRDENEKETQYIVNYYPSCDGISVIPNTAIINVPNLKDETPLLVQEDKTRNEDELNLLVKSNIDDAFNASSNIIVSESADKLMVLEGDESEVVKKKELTSILKANQRVFSSLSVSSSVPNCNFNKPEISTSNAINFNSQTVAQEPCKNTKDETSLIENGSSLPEKSLPLKKKAKMKRTVLSATSIQSGDLIVNQFKKNLVDTLNHPGKAAKANDKKESESDSDSDVPLVMHMNKNRENCNFKNKRKNKDRSSVNNVPRKISKKIKTNENSDKESLHSNVSETRDLSITNSWKISDRKKYKTIFEVLEDLKAKKLLTDAIVDILTAGLVEMKADVLSEMMSKSETTTNEYSTQLKAFALMVHFKQPVAFRRLKEIFGNGWPSYDIIKDWKRRLNNQRKLPVNKLTNDEKEGDT